MYVQVYTYNTNMYWSDRRPSTQTGQFFSVFVRNVRIALLGVTQTRSGSCPAACTSMCAKDSPLTCPCMPGHRCSLCQYHPARRRINPLNPDPRRSDLKPMSLIVTEVPCRESPKPALVSAQLPAAIYLKENYQISHGLFHKTQV